MNSRIALVSENEVLIDRNIIAGKGVCVTRLVVRKDGLGVFGDAGEQWDAEGCAALIDCLNCLEATGSFAALADTSAVPFVGKIFKQRDGHLRRVVFVEDDRVWACHANGKAEKYVILQDPANMLPLTPAPKVRPYTESEAAQHLDRVLKDEGEAVTLHLVGKGEVVLRSCEYPAALRHVLLRLLTDRHWADDVTPCGVVEEA